jgi:MYXO-CTERM domain-containing protein
VKRSNLAKIIGIGFISLSTIMLPLTMSVSAQVNNPNTDSEDVYEDNDMDWGWLGLLGLAGLAGLAGRKREEPTRRYPDTDPVTRTGYRE